MFLDDNPTVLRRSRFSKSAVKSKSAISPARIMIVGLGLMLCSLTSYVRAEDTRVDRIDILQAGTYQATVKDTVLDKSLAAGSREVVANPTLQSSGTTVTAKLGNKFGIQYRIVGVPEDAPVTIERVTIFPPAGLRNPQTGETIYRQEIAGQNSIGEVSVRGYGFDNAWELVPGVWRFELWYAGRKMAEQSFTVVLP